MIGIVIVSHSARLAEGVLELARGMAGEDVKLAAAGGLDLPDRPLGTDPGLVARAIEAVDSGDGVLVLMDLGSAVLSAEMALELMDPALRDRVALCEAPLVEGAVAAAVQARLGGTLEQVMGEARGALAPKREHLGQGAPEAAAPVAPVAGLSLELEVRNRLGLHARPAARLVQTAGRFPAVRIVACNRTLGRGPVEARSINGIASLGVLQGHRLELQAEGPGASEALEACRQLAEANFGDAEEDAAPPLAAPAAEVPEGALAGLPGSPGIAYGPLRHVRIARPEVPREPARDADSEQMRLDEALGRTRARIGRALVEIQRRSGRNAAGIFEAHLLYLEDEGLVGPARRMIQEGRNAADAWDRAVEAVAEGYRALEDDYQRGRAADVVDVGRQVLASLLGEARPGPLLEAPGILVAQDLSPADTARLDPAKVQAICTAQGGPTSHSAILARTFGIPAVVGLGEGILALAEGCPLVVDADRGWVLPKPGEAVVARYAEEAERRRDAAGRALAESGRPAVTRDGRRVEIGANIGSLAEAKAAVAAGAEGVGLLRTEFLYLDRETAPDEEEQFASYRAIAEALAGRPLIVRTLDIGGDKPLPYLDLGQEANPFLGWRALRLCLARPEFFKVQLRAILRVAALHPVRVMFPMVATLAEVRAAKALLAEARAELAARGVPVPERLETGIMVEIPAAALRARELAAEVDFFSIGTNDLTQYAMAAERGNPRVAALTDAFHPAVLELIRQVAEGAHAHGKWVGICGELGGEPLALPILLGLGLDELSMSAPAIPKAKELLRTLDSAEARTLAEAVLELDSAARVRAAAAAMLPPG